MASLGKRLSQVFIRRLLQSTRKKLARFRESELIGPDESRDSVLEPGDKTNFPTSKFGNK